MTAAQILGAAAAGSSLLFVWPQVVRLARTGDVDGVSVPATLWAMVGYLLWVAYALPEGLPFVLLANAQAVAGFGIVVALTARRRAVPTRVWQGAGVGLVIIAILAYGAPPGLVGLLAIVAGASGFVPQTVVAVRDADLSGLSMTTYLLIGLSSTVWAAYGIAEANAILVAPTLVILPCSLIITGRIWSTGRRVPATLAAD